VNVTRSVGGVVLAVSLTASTSVAQASSWTLTQEVIQQPIEGMPLTCWNEDDFHQRQWGGDLSSTFTATEQLCDDATDGVSSGGEGLYAYLSEYGRSTSPLRIVAPDGSFHQAQLMGTTRFKGKTRYDWAVCWVPPYSISTNTSPEQLTGGTWTWTVNGPFTSGGLGAYVLMTDAPFQQMYCPLDQQNLRP
jgi:hypothetical protein